MMCRRHGGFEESAVIFVVGATGLEPMTCWL